MLSSLARPRALRLAAWLAGGLTALLLFLHYFLPAPALDRLAQPVLQSIVWLSAGALALAALSLAGRHLAQVRAQPTSRLFVVGFVIALAAGLLSPGAGQALNRWLLQWTITPGLAALFALLPIFLAAALFRRLRLWDVGSVLMVLTLVILLMAQTPDLAAGWPALAGFRHNLLVGPVAAALRGVLLGAALGVILAALGRGRRVE